LGFWRIETHNYRTLEKKTLRDAVNWKTKKEMGEGQYKVGDESHGQNL
jgi:hypothetical protein